MVMQHCYNFDWTGGFRLSNWNDGNRQGECPQIGQQYGIKNKAAIALQCKLNGKLIAALLFTPWGDSLGKTANIRLLWNWSWGVANWKLQLMFFFSQWESMVMTIMYSVSHLKSDYDVTMVLQGDMTIICQLTWCIESTDVIAGASRYSKYSFRICDQPPRNQCKVTPGSFSVHVISRKFMS